MIDCQGAEHPVLINKKGQISTPAHGVVSLERWRALNELGGEVPACVKWACGLFGEKHDWPLDVLHESDEEFKFLAAVLSAKMRKAERRFQRCHIGDPLVQSYGNLRQRYVAKLWAAMPVTFMRCHYRWPRPVGDWVLDAQFRSPGDMHHYVCLNGINLTVRVPPHWLPKIAGRNLAILYNCFVAAVVEETDKLITLDIVKQDEHLRFYTVRRQFPIEILNPYTREKYTDYFLLRGDSDDPYAPRITESRAVLERQRLLHSAPEGVRRHLGLSVPELRTAVLGAGVH
jgi:hypothetical protein